MALCYGSNNFNEKFNLGLRIFTTLLGGGATNDGIDKVDNGGGAGSPMQVNEFNFWVLL